MYDFLSPQVVCLIVVTQNQPIPSLVLSYSRALIRIASKERKAVEMLVLLLEISTLVFLTNNILQRCRDSELMVDEYIHVHRLGLWSRITPKRQTQPVFLCRYRRLGRNGHVRAETPR